MKKRIALLELLLAAVLVLSGCNLIGYDEALDNQTPVLKIGADSITKGELKAEWDENTNYMVQMYAMFGQPIDVNDAQLRSEMLSETVNSMIERTILKQKAAELGLDQFTAEEEQAMAEEAQTTYDAAVEQYAVNYTTEGEQPAEDAPPTEEAKQQAIAELAAEDYTLDRVLENVRKTKMQAKVKEYTIKDVAVTEEDITTAYDAKVAEQKETYATTLNQYATDLNNGTAIYYTPAGYRFVKHVLIQIADADKTHIAELESTLSTNANTRASLEATLAETIPEDADAETKTAMEATQADAQTHLDELNTADAATQAELTQLRETAFAAIKPDAEAVLAKAQLGLNFDSLMNTYGQDPGMTTEPAMSRGYPVCEGLVLYEQPFQDAAMALAQPGDLSGLVQTAYGYHIIQYTADAVEGAIDPATVHDTLQAELLTTKQDETYAEAVRGWADATDIKLDEDKLL